MRLASFSLREGITSPSSFPASWACAGEAFGISENDTFFFTWFCADSPAMELERIEVSLGELSAGAGMRSAGARAARVVPLLSGMRGGMSRLSRGIVPSMTADASDVGLMAVWFARVVMGATGDGADTLRLEGGVGRVGYLVFADGLNDDGGEGESMINKLEPLATFSEEPELPAVPWIGVSGLPGPAATTDNVLGDVGVPGPLPLNMRVPLARRDDEEARDPDRDRPELNLDSNFAAVPFDPKSSVPARRRDGSPTGVDAPDPAPPADAGTDPRRISSVNFL